MVRGSRSGRESLLEPGGVNGRDEVGASEGYPGRMVGRPKGQSKELGHPWQVFEFVGALIRGSSKIQLI